MEEKIHTVCSLVDENEITVRTRTFADGSRHLVITGNVTIIVLVTESGKLFFEEDIEDYEGYYTTPYEALRPYGNNNCDEPKQFVNTAVDRYKYVTVIEAKTYRELTVWL